VINTISFQLHPTNNIIQLVLCLIESEHTAPDSCSSHSFNMPSLKRLKPRQGPLFHASNSVSSSSETPVTASGSRSFAQIVQGDYATDFRRFPQPADTEEKTDFGFNITRSEDKSQGHNQDQQQQNCKHKVKPQRKQTLFIGFSISDYGFVCEVPYTISKIPEWTPLDDFSLVNARVKDRTITAEMSTWDPSALVGRWSRARTFQVWGARSEGRRIYWQRIGR
jgi:hypothetical protein